MDSRQRIKSVFDHRAADRTPCFEYVLMSDEITRHVLKRPYSLLHWDGFVRERGWANTVRQWAADVLDIAGFFGHDMIYQCPNRVPNTGKVPGGRHEQQGASDDPVENVRIRNEAGRRELHPPSDDSLLIYDCLREEMGKRGMGLPILAPAYSHGVWTDIDLMQTMILEPDVAREHFALATDRARLSIGKYVSLGVDMIGIGGDFAGNSPLISPESYRAFIVPELRKLSDMIHSAGLLAVNASDGNLWSVIDDFLVGAGVDGYLEIDLHAGMDLKRLKDRYGARITFLGNMDCGNTLSFASPEQIREAAVRCLEEGMGDGGHVFTASNAITDSVPIGNYFAMVNAYRSYFNMEPLA